jgi:hypothetical protein
MYSVPLGKSKFLLHNFQIKLTKWQKSNPKNTEDKPTITNFDKIILAFLNTVYIIYPS